MKKPKKPKIKRHQAQTEKGAPEEREEKEPMQNHANRAPASIVTRWRYFYRLLLRVGKVASAISAIGAFALLATPQIRVLPSVVIDPQNTFGTQLAIVNQGHVPVFDLNFSCNVDAADRSGPILKNVVTRLSAIKTLWPNQTATRNCSIILAAPDTNVEAIVDYRWPIYFLRTTAPFYFTARKGTAGYFLVPDVRN